jgi:cytochrome c-type biogenesis protein
MAGFDISYVAALVAGLLSFLSPCVLPLVPPYLCFLGGVSARQLGGAETLERAQAWRVVLAAAMFVLGFATVFIAFGATATAFGQLVAQHLQWLGYVAGAIIIVLGLHFLGALRIPWLYREARLQLEQRPAGLLAAYVVGLAFAFGWTPCVGPVLAAILFVAASEDTAWHGAGLLAAYAAGIGAPFLFAALAVRPFMAFMRRFRVHVHRIEQIMGVLLVLTGVLFLTGSMGTAAYWLLEAFPVLGRLG